MGWGFLTFVVGCEGLFFDVSLATCTGIVVVKKKKKECMLTEAA